MFKLKSNEVTDYTYKLQQEKPSIDGKSLTKSPKHHT